MADQQKPSPPFNPYKHPRHFVRHIITSVLLVVIVFVSGLFFAGTGLFSPFSDEGAIVQKECKECPVVPTLEVGGKQGSYEEGYQAALGFARQRLYDEGVVKDEGKVYDLSATIKSISGQEITVEFEASDLDIFQKGMATKIAIIADDTIVEKYVRKSAEQIKKEEKETEKPEEYDVQIIKVGDLKVGDNVRIRSDVDIRADDSFEVRSMELLEDNLVLDEEEKEEAVFPDGNFTDPSPI